jgi:molybdate transport system ATP-binding protein
MRCAAEGACRDAAKPFLSLEGVTLRLYGRKLFPDTWWTIHADEHWAIVGPNGSGKTTLARALCGKVPVVKGRIAYHFAFDPLPYRQVAMVSFGAQQGPLQRRGHYYQARWNAGIQETETPVAEYLSAPSVRRINPYQVLDAPWHDAGFAADRERVISLLAIGDLLQRDLIQLSDGERRKVAIARALLRRPAMLILDNPFTGLDASYRQFLQDVLTRLMEERLRVVVATPHLHQVPAGITHLLSVEQGRVVAQRPYRPGLPPDAEDSEHALPTFPQAAVTSGRPGGHSTPLVEMRGVHVRYGRTHVLTGVDWTVHEGEHWALLGPNGAGKTTLLSLILGDHPQAYANAVSLFGRRRGSGESIWEIKARIGWVSPELHLYYPPRATCLDVVCSGLRDSVGLYQPSTSDERLAAMSWLAQLDMGTYAGHPFGALSEGQQRLVLIARALVKGPCLLVLDEPCQGLDAANQRRILRLVDAASSQTNVSLIYVTHDLGALPQAITHLLRLDAGRVAFRGRIEDDPQLAQTGDVV